MKHLKISISLVCLLLFIFPVTAQHLSFDSIPEWVIMKELAHDKQVSKYDVPLGYYIQYSTTQVDVSKEAYFSRTVYNVKNYSGITKVSQLQVEFDTTYQQLSVHHLIIWRDGKPINRTKELNFKTINQEINLDQGIYVGHLTVYEILKDIRIGDLIDFAYTLTGNNPIFQPYTSLIVPLESNNYIEEMELKLILPQNEAFYYTCNECNDFSIMDTTEDEQLIIKLTGHDVLPMSEFENNMPSYQYMNRFFNLSNFKNWTEVNHWAQGVFALENAPDLSAVHQEIYTGDETMESKINKAIDFVQDEIRYMGIETGIGSIKPFAPEEVVKHRFGDCKDVSLLLVHLLKSIGVDTAYPVLVNSYLNHTIAKHLPSGSSFNHVIVQFNYNGKTYWIDPTMNSQGGSFQNIYCIDYGKCLVVGKAADSLTTMNISEKPSKLVFSDKLIVSSVNRPAILQKKVVYKGFMADIKRSMAEYYTLDKSLKDQEENLKLLYPEARKTKETVIDDDMISNEFSLHHEYEVDDFWVDGKKNDFQEPNAFKIFRFEPQVLHDFFEETACAERNFDYEQNYPFEIDYQMEFDLPEKMILLDEYYEANDIGFKLIFQTEQLNANSFIVKYNLKTTRRFIKAEEFEQYCKAKSKVKKNLFVGLIQPDL